MAVSASLRARAIWKIKSNVEPSDNISDESEESSREEEELIFLVWFGFKIDGVNMHISVIFSRWNGAHQPLPLRLTSAVGRMR